MSAQETPAKDRATSHLMFQEEEDKELVLCFETENMKTEFDTEKGKCKQFSLAFTLAEKQVNAGIVRNCANVAMHQLESKVAITTMMMQISS